MGNTCLHYAAEKDNFEGSIFFLVNQSWILKQNSVATTTAIFVANSPICGTVSADDSWQHSCFKYLRLSIKILIFNIVSKLNQIMHQGIYFTLINKNNDIFIGHI